MMYALVDKHALCRVLREEVAHCVEIFVFTQRGHHSTFMRTQALRLHAVLWAYLLNYF